MTAAQATYVAEYGCERRCRVEVDLDEMRTRMTLAMLRDYAATNHDDAHHSDAAVSTPRPDVVVRAGVLEAAS